MDNISNFCPKLIHLKASGSKNQKEPDENNMLKQQMNLSSILQFFHLLSNS